MGTLSPVHWILVILVILLVFGPNRLAGVGKGLGEGIKSFKKGLNTDDPEPKPEDQKQITEKTTDKEADKATVDKPDEKSA
jgi:sec-independent protein translocase protein TatA